MSRGGNEINELTWARITSASTALTDEEVIAAKAGFIAKIFRIVMATTATNIIFFEHGTTAIGPHLGSNGTGTHSVECEFEAPVGLAITATSSGTGVLTLFVGYKYIKETGNN